MVNVWINRIYVQVINACSHLNGHSGHIGRRVVTLQNYYVNKSAISFRGPIVQIRLLLFLYELPRIVPSDKLYYIY